MKFLSTFLFSATAAAVVGFANGAGTEQCNMEYEMWKTQLVNMYQSDCMNKTETAQTAPTQVNCESKQCVDSITSLRGDFETFYTMCRMDNFAFDQDIDYYVDLVDALKTLPCNQCIVKYSEFNRVLGIANSYNCIPSNENGYGCDEKCLPYKQDLIARWSKLIESLCHPHMPGGCGAGDGPTEGEVYDLVNSMSTDMDRLRTSMSFCNECAASLGPWYSNWAKLASANCIHSEQIDLVRQSPTLAVFDVEADCSDACVEQINSAIHQSYVIAPSCKDGLVSTHISKLVNSINEKNCEKDDHDDDEKDDDDDETWNFLGSKAAKGFFTLTVVALGVIITYFLIKCASRRRVSKYDTQESVWKQGLPQTEMRSRSADDEKGLIYGDDDE